MQVEYIIVGQGLSGSWLCWHLLQMKKSFICIDLGLLNTASRNSAGIINPTTGKRFVVNPMVETLLPFAIKSYSDVGNFFSTKLIHETSIVNFFYDDEQVNYFLKRIEEKKSYLKINVSANYSSLFNYENGVGTISPCYQVAVNIFLDCMQKYLSEKGNFLQSFFDEQYLQISENNICYKNIQAQKIIFCDGVASANRNLWKHLSFSNTKGEVLLVKIPDLDTSLIYKNKYVLVPIYDQIFWVGASNSWKFEDDNPSQLFYQTTKNWLQNFLKTPFEIVDHIATIRPTMSARKAIYELHPQFSNVAILNGMGTKGSSQAPYYAKELLVNF